MNENEVEARLAAEAEEVYKEYKERWLAERERLAAEEVDEEEDDDPSLWEEWRQIEHIIMYGV